jgi:7-carboxy-7-deazaguanine synthase
MTCAEKLKTKKIKDPTLIVSEIFYSIQGEGLHQGLPTIFIRLAGCNLSCTWCDTAYARDFESGKAMKLSEIIKEIKKYSADYVCITGGEPLLQKQVKALIHQLLKLSYNVDIETNGSVSLKNTPLENENLFVSMDIKCPSSGMEQKMEFSNISLLRYRDQLKFVIKDLNDYEYAKNIINNYKPVCNIVFMPVYGVDPNMIAMQLLKDGLKARVLIQLHKLILGERIGV